MVANLSIRESGKQLYAEICNGNVAAVRALLRDNLELRDHDTGFGSWLHVAADSGHIGVVKLLLELEFDPNQRSGILEGNSLNEAAAAGHLDIVKLLHKCGAEIDQSHQRISPVFSAIYNDHPEVLIYLLENGADPEREYTRKNGAKLTAVSYAKELGKSRIVELLQQWPKAD